MDGGFATAAHRAEPAGATRTAERARFPRQERTSIDPFPDETAVRVSPSSGQIEEWATVLAASRIRHRLVRTDAGWALLVATDDSRRAAAVLRAYERENAPEARQPPPPLGRGAVLLGLATAALVLALFAVTGERRPGAEWFERGSAAAARISRGELWRTVTALTLHADLGHALGNAVACAVLIPAVGQALGPGTALFVLLLSGALGNLATALVHGPPHDSVGISTLTFAAIGVLTARAVAGRGLGDSPRRRPWVAIVTSLVLLSLLGTAQGADVLAHVFGLASGFVVGGVALVARAVGTSGRTALGGSGPRQASALREWVLGGAAIALVAASWGLAWVGGGVSVMSGAAGGGEPLLRYAQPTSRMAQPAFQIFVMWRIRSPSKSMT